ncbi:MAG TPA: response regulator [Thermoanaerobaculia bacterium]
MNLPTDTHRLRVLLIDDDDVIAGSLRQYLATRDCDVTVAVDRDSAMLRVAAQEFDVIFVDPYLTGAVHDEHAALITAARSRQPHASLIVLTAYASREIAQAAREHRALAVLTKPQSVVFLGDLVSSSRDAAQLSSL